MTQLALFPAPQPARPTQTASAPRHPERLDDGNTHHTTCPHCGHPTITATPNDRVQILVHCDPFTLTTAQETQALLTSIRTFLVYQDRGEHLDQRLPLVDYMRRTPADKCTVIAEHHCNRPPLGTTRIPPPDTTTSPLPATPPF